MVPALVAALTDHFALKDATISFQEGSSLLSMEGVLGRSPPGEAFWPCKTAGGQPASETQIGFWVFWLLLTVSVQKRTTDEHRWTPVLRSDTAEGGQILNAGLGISFAFLRVTGR